MDPLHVLAWASIVAGVFTAAAILIDVRAHPQRMPIMSLVWPITGLYTPVFGYWLYRWLGRSRATDRPMPEQRPFWESIFLSSTHCGAGCVLGDVIGPPLVSALGLTLLGRRLFADYVAEFAFAYVAGIAFQFFPIMRMRRLRPTEALKEAVKADTLSLVAFEVGMFGWMAVVAFGLGRLYSPTSIVFWFAMQIGMLLGFATTFPANWLLIKAGVKSGM